MVVSFVRKIGLSTLFIFLVIGHLVAGQNLKASGASDLARNNFIQSISELSETIKACEDEAKVIEIPHWKKLGTDRQSLLMGIRYYNLKRDNECTAQAAKDALIAVKLLEMSGLSDWEKDPSIGFVDMILDSWWMELEAEYKYRSEVSQANQEKIDSISGLQQPFKLIQSWDASGN